MSSPTEPPETDPRKTLAIYFSVIVVAAFVLLGIISVMRPAPVENGDPRPIGAHLIVVDGETGCEYFKHAGIHPRFGRDGRQICRGVVGE